MLEPEIVVIRCLYRSGFQVELIMDSIPVRIVWEIVGMASNQLEKVDRGLRIDGHLPFDWTIHEIRRSRPSLSVFLRNMAVRGHFRFQAVPAPMRTLHTFASLSRPGLGTDSHLVSRLDQR